MNRSNTVGGCVLCVLSIALAVGCTGTQGTTKRGGVQVGTIEHRGFEGCVELAAGATRLVVVPQWAGRLSVVDFGSGNLLKHHAAIDGKALSSDVPWMPWDGNATDLMREGDGRSQWPPLWLHPYEMVETGPDSVTLESGPSAETGLRVRKTYVLDPSGTALTYTITITRVSGDAGEGWTVWERALMPVERYALAPLKRGGAFPEGFKPRDGGVVEPADRVSVAGDYLVMRKGTEKGAGLAVQLSAGWLAAVSDAGVLAMTFPIRDGRSAQEAQEAQEAQAAQAAYPHFEGATAIPWLGSDVIEMEPVGPLVHLQEGESASFTQVWHWLPLPADVDVNHPATVGAWVDAQVGH